MIRTSAAIAGLVASLVMFHNGVQSGSFTIAGSSWFNLWVGLNDSSPRNLRQPVVGREFRIFEASAATFPKRNQILRDKIVHRIQQRGLWVLAREQLARQYFRLFDASSYLTDQLPGGFIAARGGGYVDAPQWTGWWIRATSFAIYAAVLVGFAAGIILCPPAGRRWMWVAMAFVGYNLVIFSVLHVKSRYRVQVLPFLFFYSACAINEWQNRGQYGRSPELFWRLGLAAATASGLLFLAFAGPMLDT
jgi:hypothetical protein